MVTVNTNPNVGVRDRTGIFDQNEADRIADTRGKSVVSVDNSAVGKANVPLVEQVRDQSIQERGKRQDMSIVTNIASIFQAADTLPRWWSAHRDHALYDLWHVSDLLSGAMYMMASKMSTIPFHIEARDMSITAHLQDAERFERKLHESSEWGTGWGQFFQKQVESLLGQDNGRFMEIIDLSRNKASAVRGPAISVATLDPSRCQRTSDPEFPVLYRRTDGKLIKLHWTRVAFEAQLPSSRVDMYGIGLCAVSRSAGYARRMLDIAKYNEEKLGSRPMRGIVTVGGGLDPEEVGNAMAVAGDLNDSKGLQRYQWLPIVGSPDIESPTIELTSLSVLPDGFDEQKSTEVSMAAIALAFGVDARELWPGQTAASTRADALLSHIKQRGKGPGHILQETERMFNNWFLPRYLRMVFDFQDDAQDRQKAEIRQSRSSTRQTDIDDGVSNKRTERERMVKEGELKSAQFELLELSDGRLPDGTPIEVLFFREDPIFTELLTLSGISDPLDLRANDPESTLDEIAKNLSLSYELLSTESRQIQKRQIDQSIAALKFIRDEYEQLALIEQQQELAMQESIQSSSAASPNPKVNPESEEPINKRPDDEQNLSALENSPREMKGLATTELTTTDQENPDMNKAKALQEIRNRESNTPQDAILKGIEEMMWENMPEPTIPIIHVEPVIEISMPEFPVQDIHIHVEKQDAPEVIVQAPNITVKPEITVEPPNVTVEMPDTSPDASTEQKDASSEYEVVEILERDNEMNISKILRRRVDETE